MQTLWQVMHTEPLVGSEDIRHHVKLITREELNYFVIYNLHS